MSSNSRITTTASSHFSTLPAFPSMSLFSCFSPLMIGSFCFPSCFFVISKQYEERYYNFVSKTRKQRTEKLQDKRSSKHSTSSILNAVLAILKKFIAQKTVCCCRNSTLKKGYSKSCWSGANKVSSHFKCWLFKFTYFLI